MRVKCPAKGLGTREWQSANPASKAAGDQFLDVVCTYRHSFRLWVVLLQWRVGVDLHPFSCPIKASRWEQPHVASCSAEFVGSWREADLF